MTRHMSGRWLAERTGWDVMLVFPGTGQEGGRGRVGICTHPKLPGWRVGHHGRRWALAGSAVDGPPILYAYDTLWQAVEAGNALIERFGGGRVA